MVASGHGVSSRPVSTSLRPSSTAGRRAETIASICAQKEQMEVQIEREKSGMRSRSTGSSGTGIVSWRRTKKKPTTSMAATSASTS
jgi:hypothetical protein